MLGEHEACPACRKIGRDNGGDNLFRYMDGHAFCFSCGYRERQTNYQPGVKKEEKFVSKILPIPRDADQWLPTPTLAWLRRYGITDKDISDNDIRYSPNKEWLIFPYYGEGRTIIAWQARRFDFGTMGYKKWFNQGELHQIIHVLNDTNLTYENKNGIILVEDILSAIKVGKVCPCMPLFGSTVNLTMLARIKKFTDNVTFWLDFDKKTDVLKMCYQAGYVGLKANKVITVQDPKVYSKNDISQMLEL